MQESMSYRTGAYFFVFMLGVIAGMGILGGILDAESGRERDWGAEEAHLADYIRSSSLSCHNYGTPQPPRKWID